MDNPWIEIVGGNKWYFGKPDNDLNLYICDVGKALSQINRFGGNTKVPYSVAQHSVWVADWLFKQYEDRNLALAGLLHDVPEIVIGDITTPLKEFLNGPVMDKIDAEERRVERTVLKALGVKLEEYDKSRVKHADVLAAITEKRDLLCPDIVWDDRLTGGLAPHPDKIVPVDSSKAMLMFVEAFKRYSKNVDRK